MNRAIWLIRRWSRWIGLPGIAGVILLILAAVVYLGLVLPEEKQLVQLSSDIEHARTHHPSAIRVVETLPQQLQMFYAAFPSRQKMPQLLEKIYQAAHSEQLQLKQGNYKYTIDKTEKIGTYQIILPVKGSYVAIRKFIAKALNTVPSAALDEVSFKRSTVGDTELDAKIMFTVFMRVT